MKTTSRRERQFVRCVFCCPLWESRLDNVTYMRANTGLSDAISDGDTVSAERVDTLGTHSAMATDPWALGEVEFAVRETPAGVEDTLAARNGKHTGGERSPFSCACASLPIDLKVPAEQAEKRTLKKTRLAGKFDIFGDPPP